MDFANAKRLKILVVEDDEIDKKQVERFLSRSSISYDVEFTEYLDNALKLLDQREFDILLLDLNLPDSNGLGTLVAVEKAHPNLAKIVVTGECSEGLGLEAVAKGAQDYLVKGKFDIDILVRAINYSIERKKSEEALQESKDKLNAMLESISDPMIMVDKDLHIIWTNEASKNLFGDDIMGKKCFQVYHGKDTQFKLDSCTAIKAFQDGQAHSCDFQVVDKNGTKRYFHCTANVALRDNKGNQTAVIAIARDITDRKNAEEKITAAYKKAEKANRQLKETQSQLVQNEKMASIGQLAAGVAHEMNTPVGFVASNFQTLESYIKKIQDMFVKYEELLGQIEALGNPELRNTVEGIGQTRGDLKIDFILEDIEGLFNDSREGLERVTSIIQNLKDFSRIDQPGSRDEYDLNKGIEATLVVARNEIKYDADVKTEFSELPMIFCQSGQINQVFLNILVNAAQAIKSQERDKKGTITIKTYTTEDGVVCEISDDGPGIPPENLSKIFDPFFTTKPAGKGTGLGLNVSYDIVVNKHNGRLLVDSTVGEGTKFTIKLPIGTKENDEKEIMNDGKENSIICRR
jgi:PAS domain S-box-containing protein